MIPNLNLGVLKSVFKNRDAITRAVNPSGYARNLAIKKKRENERAEKKRKILALRKK